MKTKEQILQSAYNKSTGLFLNENGFAKWRLDAMDEYAKSMCMDLLDYIAKNKIIAMSDANGQQFLMRGESLTKEQLFENFL